MKENIILIGILCITISSCKPGSGSNNKSHAKDVSIAIDLDREDKLSLYDLFSSIELIPLETKNESLLQFLMEEPDQVYKIDDLFYLLDRPQDAVFIFNQDGKFIRRVSKSGKGNGEYVSADAFAITDHHQIEILSSIGRSIYCYDSLGMNFLERRIFPSELPVIHHFFPLNEDEYILYASHPKENEGNMYIYSWKDKNYTKLGYKLPDWTPFGPKLSVPFYMLNDQLCFAQTYNGDVFTLSKDKKQLNLRYSWDFGDKTFSLSAIPENKELSYYIDMLKNISYDYAIQFLIYKENSSFYFTVVLHLVCL